MYFYSVYINNMTEVSDDQLRKFLSKKSMEDLRNILRDVGVYEDVISRHRRKDYLITLILGNPNARSVAESLYSTSSAGTGSAQRGPKALPNRGVSYYSIIYVVVNNEPLRNFFTESNLTKLQADNPIYIDAIVRLLDDHKLARSLIVDNYDFFIDMFFDNIDVLHMVLGEPDILQYYITNPKDRKVMKEPQFRDLVSKEPVLNILRYLNIFPNIYGKILSDIKVLDMLHSRLDWTLTNTLYNKDLLELLNAYPNLFSEFILADDSKYKTLLGLYQRHDLVSAIKNNVSLNKILGLNPENMYTVASNIDNFTYIITRYSRDLNTILAKPETLLHILGAKSTADIDATIGKLQTLKKQTVSLPPVRGVLPSLPPPPQQPRPSPLKLPVTHRIPPATIPPLSSILESMKISDIRNITMDNIDYICKQYPVYCTRDGDINWRPLLLQLLSLTDISINYISKEVGVTSYLDFLKYLLTVEVTPDQVIDAVRSARELTLRYVLAKLPESEWTEDKIRELDTVVQSANPNIAELISSYLPRQ